MGRNPLVAKLSDISQQLLGRRKWYMKGLKIFMHIYIYIYPKPSCASFPSVRTNLTVQLCARNVHEQVCCMLSSG